MRALLPRTPGTGLCVCVLRTAVASRSELSFLLLVDTWQDIALLPHCHAQELHRHGNISSLEKRLSSLLCTPLTPHWLCLGMEQNGQVQPLLCPAAEGASRAQCPLSWARAAVTGEWLSLEWGREGIKQTWSPWLHHGHAAQPTIYNIVITSVVHCVAVLCELHTLSRPSPPREVAQ